MISREVAASNAEAARLEEALSQARSAAKAHGVGVKARLQALQIAYAFVALFLHWMCV